MEVPGSKNIIAQGDGNDIKHADVGSYQYNQLSTPFPTESLLTESFHTKNAARDVKLRELELKETHREEKALLHTEVAELKKNLAECKNALQKSHDKIQQLESKSE